ncbi:MAG: hypothetical protein ACI4EF_13060, partial [Coprococcus sp.]
LNKREITNKALRIDSRMAKDIETLSECTGHSQNDIIVMAARKYLFENRKYFLRDMIEDKCLERLEREIIVLHQESHLVFGYMSIDIEKTDETDIYFAKVAMKNKFNELIFYDERKINVTNKEWKHYKEFLYENIIKYIDFEEPGLKNYFYEKFSYE